MLWCEAVVTSFAAFKPISASKRRIFSVHRSSHAPNGGALAPKLHVTFQLDGSPYVILMSQMIPLPSAEIGLAIEDASVWRDDIVAAVDLLVSGFLQSRNPLIFWWPVTVLKGRGGHQISDYC